MKKTLRIVSLALVSIMLVFVLASCGMGTYEKRLEKAGYDVDVADEADLEELNELYVKLEQDYEAKAYLTAKKTELNSLTFESVTIIKFASKKQATAYAEETDGAVQKGKIVIFGTEDAVDVALGE